jgi:uncharacterized Zn-binding protein involved in type VI secretion
MGTGPVARITDGVFFPKCGVYPIVTGSPLWVEAGMPVAHIGSMVACPGGGWIIQGSLTLLNSGIPTARLMDAAVSVKCGGGVIISGSPLWMES